MKAVMRKLYFGLSMVVAISTVLGFFTSSLNADSVDSKYRQRRYISLTIGLTRDEELPYIPKDAQYKGDFRKLTKVEAAPELNRLRFTPRNSTGVATMTIHDASGQKVYELIIDVRKSNLTKIAQEIQSLLSDIEGINIKILNSRVLVDGQVLLPKDVDRIHSVVKQYGGQAVSIVTLSPIAERKIAEIIEREIGNPEINVKTVNGKFILEGVADDSEKAKAEIIAKTYVPDVVVRESVADGKVQERKIDSVINLIARKPEGEPEPSKLIQIVVHFVELKRDYNKGFRFQWTPNLSDNSGITFSSSNQSAGGVVTTITGTINNLLPKLNWAKAAGFARVLQSSTIMVQNRETGEVNSTTQYPYQTTNNLGQIVVQTVKAGLTSTIVPTIIGSRSDSIELGMKFTFSSLVGVANGVPIINDRTVNTKVTVRSGQSAAVGGLIANSSSTGYNRLPANESSNPIISLYASKDFQRDQSQFVAFVTPIIKASASEGSEKIKKKFRLRE